MKRSTPPSSNLQQLKEQYARSFQLAYDQLNLAQKQAVDTIEGPVLVVAGPGTGKTQVLTLRIANILRQTDTKPSSILALTFTESAAQNMRLRLAALIGPDAYYVQISTFHAFCSQLITNHLEYFPLNPASQPITDLERFELIGSIVEELPLEAVKPLNSPLFHVRSLMSNISAYKREAVSPTTLRELVEQQWQAPESITSRTERLKVAKRQQQLVEQIRVYEEYQQRLRAAGRYDFEDMLALTVEVLSREEVLLQEYQEQYLYILIDEYQDTNTVQNKVTRLLASYWGEAANIFAVGDPHQSIYRFQGASLENIVQFIQWYPKATVITLSQGYRCSALVYDVAHELIEKDTSLDALATTGESGTQLQQALKAPLTTEKLNRNSLAIVTAPDQATALIALVEKIQALLVAGTSPNEIAILYTKNRYAAEIIPLLEKWAIPYYLEGGLDAIAQPVVQQFLILCTVVVGLRQGGEISSQLFEVCTYPWLEIDRVTLFQLGRFAGKERRSLLSVMRLPTVELTSSIGEEIDVAAHQKLSELLGQLEQWGALDYQVVFTTWLETVVAQSGLHQYLTKQANELLEPLLAVYSLFAFVKQLNAANQQFRLADFVRAVETLQAQSVAIPLQTLSSTDQRVRLSTVHKAKGQEWQHVFLLHLIDGVWGNRRPPTTLPVPEQIVATASALARQSKEQRNQDDRRLLYVALTRATERVELWYAEQSEQNGVLRPAVPSIFLSELDHRQEIERVVATITASPAEIAAALVGPRPESQEHARLETYLKQLVADFPLSITALNNYLRDPAKFLYRSLLALPSAKLPHLAFGTAIHSALELLGTQRLRGVATVSEAQIFQRFDQQLQRELLTNEERERRRQRGHQVLRAYRKLQDFSVFDIWQIEYKTGYGAQAAFLHDTRLTGRIDRLDWVDNSHRALRVVDYKTGKPKTKNEILVATATARNTLSERERTLPESIRGPYQRQLLFYRLLGQLDRSFAPEISLGTFEFVEAPLDHAKIIEHTFSLEEAAVAELRGLIQTVMIEIRSLAFMKEIPGF